MEQARIPQEREGGRGVAVRWWWKGAYAAGSFFPTSQNRVFTLIFMLEILPQLDGNTEISRS